MPHGVQARAGLDLVLSLVFGLSGPGGDGFATRSAGGDSPDRGLLLPALRVARSTLPSAYQLR